MFSGTLLGVLFGVVILLCVDYYEPAMLHDSWKQSCYDFNRKCYL